jgi:ribose transport system substrate-binding protein
MKTFFKLSIALVVCGLWFVGCDRGKPSSPAGGGSASSLKLAFVTNNASEFWKIAAAGVHKYEKEAGVQVDIKMPPNGKVEEQNQILENLVTQGYNGIAVSCIAPADQVAAINKAAAKTIVICHDSDAPKSNRKLYIGTNNFEAGKVLGNEINKLLPNGGKMAVFVGTLSADNARERLRGIEEAIKGHNIEIVARKEDETDRNKARTNVEGVINGFSDINLLCGLWSYNGPAISAAIEASGKKGKILAAVFDEEDGTLNGIEKGVVQVTCVQKPFMFGYLSSKWLHELNTKKDMEIPAGGIVDTGVEVITGSNVKDFRSRLAEMKK